MRDTWPPQSSRSRFSLWRSPHPVERGSDGERAVMSLPFLCFKNERFLVACGHSFEPRHRRARSLLYHTPTHIHTLSGVHSPEAEMPSTPPRLFHIRRAPGSVFSPAFRDAKGTAERARCPTSRTVTPPPGSQGQTAPSTHPRIAWNECVDSIHSIP